MVSPAARDGDVLVLEGPDDDPALDLALEELLLEPLRVDPAHPPLLRLWGGGERVAVVLGRGDDAAARVDLDAAAAAGVPVLRRTSGGGPVVHGPGNLNVSFFLPFALHPDLAQLRPSYALVLSWVQDALQAACGARPERLGDSDLCLGGRKISGTAQARKRHGLLHHLTLLVDLDVALVGRFLRAPGRAPEYRRGRDHADFVTTLRREGLPFERRRFLDALAGRLGRPVALAAPPVPRGACEALATAKYRDARWNLEGKAGG